MRHSFFLVLALLVMLVTPGCSPPGEDFRPVYGPITSAPADMPEAASWAALHAENANMVGNVTTNAALANVSDFSSLGTVPVPSIRYAVTVPPLPSFPPSFPSGNPYLATSTLFGASSSTATIDWYVYVTPTDLASSWVEWKTTIVKSSTTIFTSYWTLATPIATGNNYESRRSREPKNSLRATSIPAFDVYQTRSFTGSGWSNTNSLVTYTVGTGTFWKNGGVTASGTQIANIVVGGVATQAVYSFAVTREWETSGSLEFTNGSTITFKRTRPDSSAIGTTATYTLTTGTINSTAPTARTLTFSTAIYGNNTMTVTVTTSSVTTTLNYSADGSGTGSVSGVSGRSISLTWDQSGAATATVTLAGQTKTVSTTVVPRPVVEVPSI